MNIAVATACILHQICAANDKQSQYHPRVAPFVGLEIPDIGVVDYCKRLRKYFNCSPSCFVTALMYIDNILTKTKKLSPEHRVVLDTLTIHRLTLVGLVLAVKYHEDSHYSQAYYAQVGGVTLSELNALERKFVQILEWDLEVSYDKFSRYFGELVSHPSTCKECQQDTAPVTDQKVTTDQKVERPPTPKHTSKCHTSSHTSQATTAPTAPPPPPPAAPASTAPPSAAAKPPLPPTKSAQVKSAFGKFTNSLHNLAATRSLFAELRPQVDEDGAVHKKKALSRRDTAFVAKENQSPGVLGTEPMETNGDELSQTFSELSMEEGVTGPDTNSSPHWHDIVPSGHEVLVGAV